MRVPPGTLKGLKVAAKRGHREHFRLCPNCLPASPLLPLAMACPQCQCEQGE